LVTKPEKLNTDLINSYLNIKKRQVFWRTISEGFPALKITPNHRVPYHLW
jgi:hypothetical protein